MDINRFCSRRPSFASTIVGQQTKPPDESSMGFVRVSHDLHSEKYNLSVEKARSMEKDDELENLREQVMRLKEEKKKAIEECVYANQEVRRLSGRNELLRSHLEKEIVEKKTIKKHKSELECKIQSMLNSNAEEARGTQHTFATLSERWAGKYERRIHELRVMAIIFGVLQVEYSESRLRESDMQQSLEVVKKKTAEMEDIKKENGTLRRQHELDTDIMYQKDQENKKLETELNNAIQENKKLSARVSELKTVNDTITEMLKQAQEDHRKSNGQMVLEDVCVKLQSSIELRRTIFNKIQDLRGNVRVFCRVRPPKSNKMETPFISIPNATSGNNWKILCREECFSFGRVFGPSTANKEVYQETAGVVETVLEGGNVCILAYGQTGSGKSHTMEGLRDDPGVNVLALQHLFRVLDGQSDSSAAVVSVSIMEIYNDEIQDLLVGSIRSDGTIGLRSNASGSGERQGPSRRQPTKRLQIRKVRQNSEEVHVPGIVKVKVSNVEDVNRIMGQAKRRRSVSSTMMNSESSRSHLIVQVEVEKQKRVSRLHLVDLAGSERIERSQVSGARLKEAMHINKSLSTLGNVFSALEHHRAHVPYRDTKLTHLLSTSTGRKAKTLMFVTVSGEQEDKAETWATLEFSKRVGKIVLQNNACEEKLDRLRKLEEQFREVESDIEKNKL